MKYLLDTNTCVYALNRSDPALVERLRAARRSDLYLSSLTVGELLFGARRSSRAAENVKRVARFVAPLRELQFDHQAGEACGALRAGLAAAGRQFGPVDMLDRCHCHRAWPDGGDEPPAPQVSSSCVPAAARRGGWWR